MSRIEELLNEFCPNGVEYITIGDVVNYEQPTKYIVDNVNYNDDYNIPVLTAGQTFILGYTNESKGLYNATKENPVIIFDDFTCAFKWVDFPFKVKSSAMKLLSANTEQTTLRYIYHIMGCINFTSDKHKRLWIGTYSKFQIPLPPLPVQAEIVRILDNFAELTAELTAELAAELTARKKQYEYYRDMLFDFGTVREGSIDCEWRPLGEVCDTITNFAAAGSFAEVSKNVPYLSDPDYAQLVRTVDLKNNFTNPNPIFVSKHSYDYLWRVNLDDVAIILPSVGNCGEVYYIEPEKLPYQHNVLAKNALLIRSSTVNMKFLKFIFESRYFQKALKKITSNMGQSRFNKTDFEKLFVPVPKKEEQERIASILDRFDKLCNDISEGLPAEIEARKKQYEYYRDKLLSFK